MKTVTRGRVEVAIWLNHDGNGLDFGVTYCRLEKDGYRSKSLRMDDMKNLCLAAQEAGQWMYRNRNIRNLK